MVGHAKNQINRIAHFRVVDYKILQLVSNVLLHKKIENVSVCRAVQARLVQGLPVG